MEITESRKVRCEVQVGEDTLLLVYSKDKENEKIWVEFPIHLATETYRTGNYYSNKPFQYQNKGDFTFYLKDERSFLKVAELEKILLPQVIRILKRQRDQLPSELRHRIWGL